MVATFIVDWTGLIRWLLDTRDIAIEQADEALQLPYEERIANFESILKTILDEAESNEKHDVAEAPRILSF